MNAELSFSATLGQGELLQRIWEIYDAISKLKSLKPSVEVNKLFSRLVLLCIPPNPIDCNSLTGDAQEMRSKLIRLCGKAEGLLENHFAAILGSHGIPLDHLSLFPYYDNYVKLSHLEHRILAQHLVEDPRYVAFIGSGPLPLTSIVLAKDYLRASVFHNYDIDPTANSLASRLVVQGTDLSKRMEFYTSDILQVTHALRDYDVVFLAALVGMDQEEKRCVIEHLAQFMAPGAILMLRSANGARGFLYPIVDLAALPGFDVLSVFHPDDEVVNSVVIARRRFDTCGEILLSNKCFDIASFSSLKHGALVEEITIEKQAF
ncbi:nicotianamine synthase-like [Wolffia australiana]